MMERYTRDVSPIENGRWYSPSSDYGSGLRLRPQCEEHIGRLGTWFYF